MNELLIRRLDVDEINQIVSGVVYDLYKSSLCNELHWVMSELKRRKFTLVVPMEWLSIDLDDKQFQFFLQLWIDRMVELETNRWQCWYSYQPIIDIVEEFYNLIFYT